MKTFIPLLSLFMTVGLFGSACNKKTQPGIAEIKVMDKAGVAQKAVKVVLFCTEPGCVVRKEGYTNELGVYREEFELPVVLRVRSVRYDTTITPSGLPPNTINKISVDSLCGEGYAQIENDEIENVSITILECN